jgi:hypothetical protein
MKVDDFRLLVERGNVVAYRKPQRPTVHIRPV